MIGLTKHPTRHNQQAGFTLIELLVVIAIIGVLASLIVVNLSGVRERGRDTQRKSDMHQLATALRLYYNDHQSYPENDSDNEIVVNGDDVLWGTTFEDENVVYMQNLPLDPLNSGLHKYQYNRGVDSDRFCAWAILENKSDVQIEKSQTDCNFCTEAAIPPNQLDAAFVVCAQ